MGSVLLIFLGCGTAPPPPAEPVTIHWDRWGVPRVSAGGLEATFYGLGWAQMEAHGEIILRLYGEARGRAAEYRGRALLASDRRMHRLGVPRRARAWYEAQPPELRRVLRAFALGMNAHAAAHPRRLSAEARRVLPVRPEDPLGQLQVAVHLHVVGFNLDADLQRFGGSGSNAIAVGPSRSASSRALLLMQPHPPWLPPYRWFEVHLSGPGLAVYGVTPLGVPLVSMGFNRDLGWAHTFNQVDGVDLYELQLVGDGYRWEGGVRPFATRHVELRIREEGGSMEREELVVESSVHGPVLWRGEDRALAVRIAGLERPGLLGQYLDMARAGDRESFEAALGRMQMPLLNVLYADRHGEIAYWFNALHPVRTPQDAATWSGAISGSTKDTLWGPYLPFAHLPAVVNPASGFLRNSNDSPWYVTFPAALRPEDFPPDLTPQSMDLRAQRSARMLLEDASITFDELVAMEGSTRSEAADRFLDDLLRSVRGSEDPHLQRAARTLEGWDRRFLPESRGAILFLAWLRHLDALVLEPWSPGRPLETPRGVRPAAARSALRDAAAEVLDAWGDTAVPWGEVMRIRRDGLDLPASLGPGEAGVFRAGFFAPAEDGREALVGGVSFVAAIEFGERIRARGLLAYGNASQPGRAAGEAQLPLLSRNELREILLLPEEIRAHASSTEHLAMTR